MTPVFKASLAYFALTFAAGFILGPIRVLVVVPRFGETVGVALETPFMLLAIIVAARWVVRRWAVPAAWPDRLAVGGLALLLQQASDIAVGIALRNMTLAQHLAHFATPAGVILIGLLLALFLAPAFSPPKAGAARAG
jgi:hypothetical protein